MNASEVANYDRTLASKKAPLLNGFDTLHSDCKPTGSYNQRTPQGTQTLGHYQNRSLPRPPVESDNRPLSEGMQASDVTDNMLDI